jgi:hypothetical protein
VWDTSVRLLTDERGVVTKDEIKTKVAQLLSDEKIKARVTMLKDAACASIAEGSSSHVNLLKLVNLLRGTIT